MFSSFTKVFFLNLNKKYQSLIHFCVYWGYMFCAGQCSFCLGYFNTRLIKCFWKIWEILKRTFESDGFLKRTFYR